MKRISLMLAVCSLCVTATDSAEAGHVAGCGCGVCRQQVVVQQLYQNLVQPPQFYYQVGEQLREDVLANRVAQLTVNALAQPLADKITDQVVAKLNNMTKVTPPPANPPPVAPVVPAAPPGPGDNKELIAKVQASFNRSCISCHSATTLNTKPFLDNIATTVPPNPWKLWGLTHTGSMPKKTPTMSDEDFQKALLTDAEVDAIRDWVLQLDP